MTPADLITNFAIPVFTVYLSLQILYILFVFSGKLPCIPHCFKIDGPQVVTGFYAFFFFGILDSCIHLILNISKSELVCCQGYRIAVWVWSCVNGSLYLFLFGKWKTTDLKEEFDLKDKLFLAVIISYPTVVGGFFFLVSWGSLVDDGTNTGGVVCLYNAPFYAYIIAAVADTFFSVGLLALFIKPLNDMRKDVASQNSLMAQDFRKVVIRNFVSGVAAISSTFGMLVYGVYTEFNSTTVNKVRWLVFNGLDLMVNMGAVAYATAPAWKLKKNL